MKKNDTHRDNRIKAEFEKSCEITEVLSKEVDEVLGERKYLLNVYLAYILKAVNSTIAYESAEEGFKDCTELLCLCGDIYNGRKISRNKNVYYKPTSHEFYPYIKEFIDKHPEYQTEDKSNKVSIFLWINGLFCKFTEYAINKFLDSEKQKFHIFRLIFKISSIENTAIFTNRYIKYTLYLNIAIYNFPVIEIQIFEKVFAHL